MDSKIFFLVIILLIGYVFSDTTTTITTSAPPTTFTTLDSCHDSDGWNINVTGYVWGIHGGIAYNNSDTCKNSTAVNEGLCIAGGNVSEPSNQTINCPADAYCSNGRCASNGTAQCVMPGNNYPCDQVTLQEVVDSITDWIRGNISLGNVIKLIVSWMDPVGHIPD